MSQSAKALLVEPEEQFALRVLGLDFNGWIELTVGRGLEAGASSFSFTASPRWPTEPNPARVQAGSACEILLGGDKLITGYVDKWAASGDARSSGLTLSGRSRTQEAIDSTVTERTRFRNRTLAQIAEAMLKPFGVEVVVDPAIAADPLVLKKFSSFKAKAGEPVFSVLERAARSRAVLLTDDPEGRLVITRIVADKLPRSKTALVLPRNEEFGGNVLAWDIGFDASALFTEYLCKGQRMPTDGDTDGHKVKATVADPFLEGRTRKLVIEPEGRADAERCKRRAQWEAAARYGKASTLGYEVHGWRQGNADLWEPGIIVPVFDELHGIEGEFLLVECAWKLSPATGSSTMLTLMPPEALELLEPKERKSGKRKRRGGWSELADGVTVYENKAGGFTDPSATTSVDGGGS